MTLKFTLKKKKDGKYYPKIKNDKVLEQKELIEAVEKKLNIPKEVLEETLNKYVDAIKKKVLEGEKVNVLDIGDISIVRDGGNPENLKEYNDPKNMNFKLDFQANEEFQEKMQSIEIERVKDEEEEEK
ncbi:MAG: HU family DNA-binding protein [Candidatus Cloacimonetes bacterium]|nr:HU family DNA-binding protein [Candidatus Cloacimonadota bacterium]